ncbi:hypothetical protein V5799_016289 [Amblyomma americanum]|uniref:Uncharacterized protein n=1 Tax=Amblyomma americanum TaxID=6943 RepID=A0AAQ4F5J7_AMBAM
MAGAGVRVAARALVWAVCTAGFLYQASDVLQLYGRHAFTVTVYKEHGSQHIRFPAITVCTEKWSKREVLCGKNHSHCLEPPEALQERLLFNAGLRSEAAYAPEELFKCHMRSMDDKCAAFSCTSMIRRTFYRAPFFMCYTFDLYQYAEARHPFRMCEVPWLYELELTAEWDPRETGPTDHVWKYPLIVHEAEVCPPEKLAPIHLRLGMRYTVSISQGQEALAYVGGYIGMWLGVSLYSIYVGLETSLGAFLRSRWHVFTQPQHVRTQ